MLDDDEDAIAVLLPDDLVMPRGVLDMMCRVRRKRGGSVLCAIDVPKDEVSAYGVFDVETVPDAVNPNVLRVRRHGGEARDGGCPVHFRRGRALHPGPAIFDALRRIEPGAGGELQLTDAISLLIDEGHPVHVVVHRGSRHDLGNPGGYLRAAVDFALDSEEYGPALREWLEHRLSKDWAPKLTHYE